MKAEDLKLIVQEKYGAIANQRLWMNQSQSSCCGTSSCCGELEFSMIGDEYKNIEGYNPDAYFINGDTGIFSITVSGYKPQ